MTEMIKVVLYQPEIPQNTGNILRLCANAGVSLHLIQPLGFSWDEKKLKRSGLDYSVWVDVTLWQSWSHFCSAKAPGSLYAMTTKAEQAHWDISVQDGQPGGSYWVFGPESRGLPLSIIHACDHACRIPMVSHSRSLNLSNAVAITVYEAWRQLATKVH